MQMQTKRMLLRDIRPAAYNPRKRLEPGEKEYEALKGSIERWGLVDPLVVNTRTGNLISGHQRYYILTNLGETETEAVVVDLDERQEKLLNVAMNKVEGQWDYGKLETLLSEFETDEILFTGFSEGEIATMFGEEADDVVEEYEDADTGDEENEDESGDYVGASWVITLAFEHASDARAWAEENGHSGAVKNGASTTVIRMD